MRWRAWARRWRATRRCASASSTGPTATSSTTPSRCPTWAASRSSPASCSSLGMIFDFDHELLALVLASTIVTAVGLIDDFGVLTPKPKIVGQIVAVFVLLKGAVIVLLVFRPGGRAIRSPSSGCSACPTPSTCSTSWTAWRPASASSRQLPAGGRGDQRTLGGGRVHGRPARRPVRLPALQLPAGEHLPRRLRQPVDRPVARRAGDGDALHRLKPARLPRPALHPRAAAHRHRLRERAAARAGRPI